MPADPSDLAPIDYQRRILPYVSRSFALTIPQLPDPVGDIVGNAYLLCRIADTIEDDPALSARRKSSAHRQFLAVLAGHADPEAFGARLVMQLSDATPRHERELVRNTCKVVTFTHSLDSHEQEVLLRCVSIMCRGMSEYQRNASLHGLQDLRDLDRYCYYVAGVVGEMLTEVFAYHSAGAREHREEMFALAPSFGEGLQLTNILKDVWEDRRRGMCWLPHELFAEYGVELATIAPGSLPPGFGDAMDYLVGVAHEHLRDAMHYTLLIPRDDVGMRRFCLWAIGMAVLTLRRIHKRPRYTRGGQVKISRRMVKAVIMGSNLTARHDRMLRTLFAGVTFGLPRNREPIDPAVSDWGKISITPPDAQIVAGGADAHHLRSHRYQMESRGVNE